MKNNSVCKENESNVFRKEREQYHEIQDLKAQMQDKNIAISELKKLIEKCKGKSVETQFDKPFVVRQPNAQRILKPSVLGKPTPFSNSPEMRSFQTKQSVNKTNVSDGSSKQVTQQNLPQNRKQAEIHTNTLTPGMYRIATSTTQNREPQLPHASRNTNPHVSTSTRVNHSTSVSRPPLKSYQVKDKVVPNNSQVKFTKKEVEDHHRISSISKKTKSVTVCNNTTNSRTSNVNVVCAECGKCVLNSNHDACVSRYLNVVNARTKKPNVVPIGDSKPKRKANKSVATTHKKTVASDTTIQKPKSYFKELYENTNQTWKWWIQKKCPSEYKWTQTTPPRPSLKWKPTGRIFSNVHLRWVPTGKLFNSCTGKVDSEPTHGSIVDIPHIHACKQTLGLSAGKSFNGQKQQRIDLNADALYNAKQENLRVWLLKMLISKKPVPECSSLVLHQMTSDHNRSELGIHDHNNEPSSSKLVPKVVPLAVKTATSRQELELLFHHHIAMLRTTEHPSDTYVFTMKMEILLESASNKLLVAFKMRHSMRMLVKDIRSQDGIDDKDNDKGSKSRSQSMKEQAYNKEQRERPRPQSH
ncbi:hypothetical protein Tco_0977880 [Tanacetum coccineum]|uniref:Uncharacterized protein n=1 Tax=Tanacetum coccineum TaxID=301880 RepID=A0ABQ5ELC4_9ASTR